MEDELGLKAHWPFQESTLEKIGNLHGKAHNINYVKGPTKKITSAVDFDGSTSYISVENHKTFQFGMENFTWSFWLQSQEEFSSIGGDIISKFDPTTRTGFQIYHGSSSPSYCGMSDDQHLHFAVDDGYSQPWESCGAPDKNNPLISVLVAHKESLYAGVADSSQAEKAARIYQWKGGENWQDCGSLGSDGENISVMSMISHQGRLYGGTGCWDWERVYKMEDVPTPHVFIYEGGTTWRDLGQLGRGCRVLSLGSYKGKLYAGLDAQGGGEVLCYSDEKWTSCGAPDGRNVGGMLAYQGNFFVVTHGHVYKYLGDQRWENIAAKPHKINQIHCIQVFRGKIYIGTWPQGYVLRYEGGKEWSICGRLGLAEGMPECNEVMDLTVYNGKLYAANIPKAQVYRHEKDLEWTLLGSLADHKKYNVDNYETWRRVTSLSYFNGDLFASTGTCRGLYNKGLDPSLGKVYRMSTGCVCSYEKPLSQGWNHVIAVRHAERLELYLNGELVSSKTCDKNFDLSHPGSLLFGFGEQNYFKGSLADVRLYHKSFSPEQSRLLYHKAQQ